MSRQDLTAEQLQQMVLEVNSWDSSLQEFEVYENDSEFFDIYFSSNTIEAIRATQYGDYNYNDDYVKFNSCGNVDSITNYQYEKELEECKDEIVDRYLELVEDGNIDNEFEDELEDELEEEE